MPLTILSGRAQIHRFGTAFGDCRLGNEGALDRLKRAADIAHLDRLILPQLTFGNALGTAAQTKIIEGPIERTTAVVEGVLIDRPGVGVGITNADCTVGVLASATQIVVMHLGLACVHRPDESPSVLQGALNVVDPEAMLWIGAAIGPCCHGYQDADFIAELRAAWGPVISPGRVRYGPRRGWPACDHLSTVEAHARMLGIEHIEIDRTCTACAGLAAPDKPGFGEWYSHTRDSAGLKPRNLVLVSGR